MEYLREITAGAGAAVGAFLARLAMHPMDKRAHKWSQSNIKAVKDEQGWARQVILALCRKLGIEVMPPPEHQDYGSPPPYDLTLEEITKPGKPVGKK